jgi:ADP-ribosyl-[dinitrogen reductase] hydrolase
MTIDVENLYPWRSMQMAKVTYIGSDRKWFEENMGRGGAILLGKRPVVAQANNNHICNTHLTNIKGVHMDQKKRIAASLMTFACGDALGASTEFMAPELIKASIGVHRDITGGGWLELEPGEVTDDTEMTLCVARSLVECQSFNMEDIANKFVVWYDDPVDIGSTVRAGIHRYIRTRELVRPESHDHAGNGGVMRALPLILLYSNDRDMMLESVVAQSRLTHNNRESDLGCRCYAELVAAALSGADKDELWRIVDDYPLFAPVKFNGKSGGYIVETMRTVLHYFFATESLEDCIIAVVNNGQDADTCGALAGGLAGAFYGPKAIPLRWLKALDRNVLKELTQLAGQLSAMKEAL